ncbi:MAG: hypothetical protein EHM61_14630 [Acidobacteria bacterium]|nr:MAG: hypothetical protein EHM61_14630 [Acidobacteriota bacterium]
MLKDLLRLHHDEQGMETLEYILVVGFIIFPLTAIPVLACRIMTHYYYQIIVDVVSLPFP